MRSSRLVIGRRISHGWGQVEPINAPLQPVVLPRRGRLVPIMVHGDKESSVETVQSRRKPMSGYTTVSPLVALVRSPKSMQCIL